MPLYNGCLFLFFPQSVVFETLKINRCFLVEDKDTPVLKTEGVNLQVSRIIITHVLINPLKNEVELVFDIRKELSRR